MEFPASRTTSRLLIGGVILTFFIILSFTWPWSRQAVPGINTIEQTVEVVPERTPAEIIAGYNAELAVLAGALESPTLTVSEASKQLDDFFFSVRVPDAARDAHLKATLEFKNTDPKKTDEQKLTTWKQTIKKLQTAVAAV